MENYISCGVYDLYVFDEKGKLITKLNNLINSRLSVNNTHAKSKGELFIKDALLNVDYLKFIQGQNDNITDFERLSNMYDTQTITFNFENSERECKLIAKGNFIVPVGDENDDTETIKSKKYIYEIPNAVIHNRFTMENSNSDVSNFDSYITFSPYNEKGDLFKLHVEN